MLGMLDGIDCWVLSLVVCKGPSACKELGLARNRIPSVIATCLLELTKTSVSRSWPFSGQQQRHDEQADALNDHEAHKGDAAFRKAALSDEAVLVQSCVVLFPKQRATSVAASRACAAKKPMLVRVEAVISQPFHSG